MSRPNSSTAPRIALVFLGVLLLLVYSIAWRGPFIFDDVPSIVDNPSLRSWSPPWGPLVPPHEGGVTVGGRPLLNFTLALNYAMAGPTPWVFRATNLIIHFGSALLLFGVIRRVWRRWRPEDDPNRVDWMAVAIAGLWALHPLGPMAVSYVVQRAESLAAACVLLSVYAFLRGTDSPAPRRWQVFSWCACLAGMATKETAAATPLLVYFADALFVGGGYAAAWRARRGYHLAMAATWLLLVALVWISGGRDASAGFESRISPWHYLLTQAGALVHYVRLVFWPDPLVFDHNTPVVTSLARAALPGAAVLLALVATIVGLCRRKPWGWLGAWFFLLLAPSSSIVPVATQTIGEHRMYLPLVAPLALVAGWIGTRRWRYDWLVFVAAMVVLTSLTAQRNVDFRSEVAIWGDTVKKQPENARALTNYGHALHHAGIREQAGIVLQQACHLDPANSQAQANLAGWFLDAGNYPAAIDRYQRALKIHARRARYWSGLGQAHFALGQLKDAGIAFQNALTLEPAQAPNHHNLGCWHAAQGRLPEAKQEFEAALAIDPTFAAARDALVKLASGNSAPSPAAATRPSSPPAPAAPR